MNATIFAILTTFLHVGEALTYCCCLIPANAADEVDSAALMNKNLLELARKQRMNTDIRRNIFCTIMSSEVLVYNVVKFFLHIFM